MKQFTLAMLILMGCGRVALGQSCTGYQDLCYPTVCGFCDRYHLTGSAVPAKTLGAYTCVSGDPHETGTVNCSACDGLIHPTACHTFLSTDYHNAAGKHCNTCVPIVGEMALSSTEQCVNDCRECKTISGQPWTQDPIYYCSTWSGGWDQLCSECPAGDWSNIAVSCDPFYCGAIDGTHCRARDCWSCW